MVNKFRSTLYKALKFVQKNGAKVCYFSGSKVYSSHNDVTLCAEIDEELNGAFSIDLLIKALDKFGENLTLVELEEMLQFKNDTFQIDIDNKGAYSVIIPNVTEFYPCEEFIQAVLKLCKLPTRAGMEVCTHLHNYGPCLVGTNRRAIIEVTHGLEFPDFSISQHCGMTLKKINPKEAEIGASENYIVFRFDDCLLSIPYKQIDFDYLKFFEGSYNYEPTGGWENDFEEVLELGGEILKLEGNVISCGPSKLIIKEFFPEPYEYFAKEMLYVEGMVYFDHEKCIFKSNSTRGIVSAFIKDEEDESL